MARDVIKYQTCLLTAIWLLVAALSMAQVGSNKLKKQVTVYRNETRVDSFLHLLVKQTGIGFSFNSKKISPAKVIQLRKGVYTVEDCLLKIQQTAGIHYALLSDHIILVDNPPQEKYRLQLSPKPPAPTATVKKSTSTKLVVTKKMVSSKPVAKVPDTPKRQEVIIQKANVDSVVIDSIARIDSIVHKDSTGLFVRNNSSVRNDPKARDDSKDRKGLFGRLSLFGKKDTTDRNDSTERIDSTKTQESKPKTNTVKQPSKKLPAASAQRTPSSGWSPKDRNDRSNRSDRKVRIERGILSYGDNQRNRDKDWNLIAGASLLRPDFATMNIGIAAHVQYERWFGDKWSWTGSVGYNYVMGEHIMDSVYVDTFAMQPGDTIKSIAHISVLLGLRYYVYKPLYLSFETGYSFATNSVAASCMTFSPAVGVQIPVGNGAIDVNVNYLWLKEKMTYPEKPRFQKGGLGFWCLRVAWAF